MMGLIVVSIIFHMNSETGEKNQIQTKVIILFSTLFLLEITFFSLSIFFNSPIISSNIFVQFGFCLTFGNMYLLNGIYTRKSSALVLYFIVYIYNLISTFLDASAPKGLYFTFKLVFAVIQAIRGLVVCAYYRKFVNKFISFYFKKYHSDQRLIGK